LAENEGLVAAPRVLCRWFVSPLGGQR
jgi:hypothetical protein